jgi:S-disulfanyl-L-cysteine oxidoreductase SoxD
MRFHRSRFGARGAAVAILGGFLLAPNLIKAAEIPPIGRTATTQEISNWDIDIEPDGTGLPPGSGSVAEGKPIYETQCASCHGPTASENPGDTGIVPNVAKLYCCATTLFDYIRRAMPYYSPRSLTPDQVYSLVALILNWNKIVPDDFTANAKTVPAVAMPEAPKYRMNPWTSRVLPQPIPQPGHPWSHDNP